MIRKLFYFTVLLAAVVFYWAYREWLSWLILMLLLVLPLFSLLLSLPAMLTCRSQIQCPAAVEQNAEVELRWQGQSLFPLPALTGRLTAANLLCGTRGRFRSGDLLPTEHCGLLTIRLRRPRCHDYLGLFSLPIRGSAQAAVLVRPTPLAPGEIPDMRRYQVTAWRPKPGGGLAENHELRLYRPGDSLRQVHWKLSAKTGKLITREAMEPVRNSMLLSLSLCGSPTQLDTKLGRLLWMSRYLLQLELPHKVACHSGGGLTLYDISCPEDLNRAMDAILRSAPAEEEPAAFPTAFWHYRIGGDGHG